MQPVVPAEMIGVVVQIAVYFVTAVGALISFMLSARA